MTTQTLSASRLAALLLVLTGSMTFAATETWVGNTSALWNAANWSGTNNPPLAGDSLVFGTAGTAGASLTNDIAAATSFASITFNAGASAFTIGTNSITMTGSLVNNSTSLQTLNIGIAATAARTYTTTAGGGNIKIGGALSGTGGGVSKAGVGTLTLLGTNTYTGTTTLSLGSIVFGSASATGISQTLGTVGVGAGNDGSITSISDGTGSASLTFTTQTYAAGGALNYVVTGGTNGTSNQIKLTQAAGFINKLAYFNGADYAYVNSTNGYVRAPSYSGSDAGFVTAGSSLTAASHNLISSSITGQGSVAVNTLKFGGTGAIDLTQTGSTIITFNTNSGILRSGGTSGSPGTTLISGGDITTATGLAYVVRADTVNDSLTISSRFLGVGTNTFTKSGDGSATLSGNNTYTGTTFGIGGTLTLSGTSASTAFQANGSGIINLNGTNTATGTSTITAQNGGTINVNAAQNSTGAVTVQTNGTLGFGTSGSVGATSILVNLGSLQAVGGTATVNTTLNTTGILTISGSNPFILGSVFSDQVTGANPQLFVTNSALTTFQGGLEIRNVSSGARTLTVAGSGNIAVTGPITSGPANQDNLSPSAFVYSGTGTVVSSGTNTYNSTTTINSGKYMLNGSHVTNGTANAQSTAYTINGSSTFGGTGTLNTGTSGINTVSINGTATLAPGNSAAATNAQTGTLDLNVTSVAFATGTTFAAQLGGTDPGDGQGFYDQLNSTNASGVITLTGSVNLTLALVNGYVPSFSGVFYLMTRADGAAFANTFNGLIEGATVTFLDGTTTGKITYLANWTGTQGGSALTGGNDIAIYNIVAIPEPPQYAVGVMAVLGTLIFLRNRRRKLGA